MPFGALAHRWTHLSVVCVCVCVNAKSLQSYLTLCDPLDHSLVACQAPLSTGFSRQEHRSGLPWPPPGDLPNTGIEPASPGAPEPQGDYFATELLGKPLSVMTTI